MGLPILQVDAFTDRPFAGNPAAVCILPGPAEPAWMQNVAREMNLSETAFLHPERDGYRLRWFTPAVEVDLCGHATLAAAHVLWEEDHLAPERQARFQTNSGLLTADRTESDWIELDFPATGPTPAPPPPGLIDALGVAPTYVGKTRFDYLLEVASETAVRALQPDIHALAGVEARGIIVTAQATTPGFDFVSRFFAPRAGVAEDPVTGSAHCALGPYWQGRLGKAEFVAYQASARGGTVLVRVVGSAGGGRGGGGNRVRLGGRAITVLRGELAAGGGGGEQS
jgi:PhzF family phenazine biosynthesis protein